MLHVIERYVKFESIGDTLKVCCTKKTFFTNEFGAREHDTKKEAKDTVSVLPKKQSKKNEATKTKQKNET